MVDTNYEYIHGYPQIASSIEDAKNRADEHYNLILHEILSH